MSGIPAKTIRLNLEDKLLLVEVARHLKTNEAQAIRLLIRAAAKKMIAKDRKLKMKGGDQ